MELITVIPESTYINETELLECMKRIGKGLIASGSPAGVVENTLTEIAQVYGTDCEILALPLSQRAGHQHRQKWISCPTADRLAADQISEFAGVNRPGHAKKPLERLLQMDLYCASVFHSVMIVFGYFFPVLASRCRSAGSRSFDYRHSRSWWILIWVPKWPGSICCPVIAAIVVSTWFST
jgi:hypothetical protein